MKADGSQHVHEIDVLLEAVAAATQTNEFVFDGGQRDKVERASQRRRGRDNVHVLKRDGQLVGVLKDVQRVQCGLKMNKRVTADAAKVGGNVRCK